MKAAFPLLCKRILRNSCTCAKQNCVLTKRLIKTVEVKNLEKPKCLSLGN